MYLKSKLFTFLLPAILVLALFQENLAELPPITIKIHDSTNLEGFIFLTPYTLNPPFTYDHAQIILNKYGDIIYYKSFFSGGVVSTTADFKLHPNGKMSFFTPVFGKFYIMDSTFTVVDSIGAVNGYETDTHELLITENGHYFLLGREVREMNLFQYKWFGQNNDIAGSPNAEVIGSVIQEFDQNKNLVFEWRAHDHFDFADVNEVWLKSPSNVDWTHSNAIEPDTDGNILLSSRHFNEITKINKQTGDIIWRMGGKKNQFTFIDDNISNDLHFSGQHDIRRQKNGNITIWNNGQYTNPSIGRAMEFKLDESNKTATLKWEYIHHQEMYSTAMGNHQVLANGNRLVNFGFVEPEYPMTVIIDNAKSLIMEIYGPEKFANYRAFHYPDLPWDLKQPEITCRQSGNEFFLEAEPGHSLYQWSNGMNTQSIPITKTGKYQVFVPKGNGGYIGSKVVNITDLSDPCKNLSSINIQSYHETSISIVPNPVSFETDIKLQMNHPGQVSISLIDILGNEELLVDGVNMNSGNHSIRLQKLNRRGLYLLRIIIGNYQVTKKVIFY